MSVAADGMEGLQLAKSMPVPIVVADVQLPDIDGISIMDRLAEREQTVRDAELQGREQHATRMSDQAALEILRLVKPKTAGAILGQVKPERAAKLTRQLLVQTCR